MGPGEATRTRRSAASRAGRSRPSATRVSRAHSGSAGGPRCPHPRGQSSMAAARSSNAAGTSSAVTWASPNERTPGVSTTQPPARSAGSGRASAATVVCRPLPTPDTRPTASAASGTRALTSVDLPTPECPTSAETRPTSRCASSSGHRSRRVTSTGRSSSRYCAAKTSGSARSAWSGRPRTRRRRPLPGTGRRNLARLGSATRSTMTSCWRWPPTSVRRVVVAAARAARAALRDATIGRSCRGRKGHRHPTWSPTTIGSSPQGPHRVPVAGASRPGPGPAAGRRGDHGRRGGGVLGAAFGAGRARGTGRPARRSRTRDRSPRQPAPARLNRQRRPARGKSGTSWRAPDVVDGHAGTTARPRAGGGDPVNGVRARRWGRLQRTADGNPSDSR